MFNKLISNLPFNPNLIGQVSFYAKRMHQEASIRRIGFALIALAMFLQMFAVITPSQKSLASSTTSADHILDNISSTQSILAAWDRTGSDLPAVYGTFDVTRQDIVNLSQTPVTLVSKTGGVDYWTIGRTSLSAVTGTKDQYRSTEVPFKVGSETIYERQLAAWNIKYSVNTDTAYQGKKADGTTFWILKDCGNYTQVGKYAPATPKLDLRKTVMGPTTLKPGDTFTYHFEYRNTASGSLADNVTIHDNLDLTHYDIVSPTNLNFNKNPTNRLEYQIGSFGSEPTYRQFDVTVKLKNPYPDGAAQVCNTAAMDGSNAAVVYNVPAACVNVVQPCPYNGAIAIGDAACKPPVTPTPPGTPPTPPPVPCKYDAILPASSANCVEPKLLCSLLDTDLDKTTRTASFKTEVSSTNQKATKIVSYIYDFGDNKKVTQNNAAYADTITHVYTAGTFSANVVVKYLINGDASLTVKTVNCSDKIDFESDKPLGESKTVKNITQNLSGSAAIDSTLHGGDVIEYTLLTTNSQDYSRKSVEVSDYVGDILDYADVDVAYLSTQGGTFDAGTKKVTWSNITLAAKTDISKNFRVTMKKPVPATNTPSNISGSFDCKIANKYGNEIDMNVACPVVKGVESLPNTGPGASLIFGFIVTMVIGYFFARSRLLARELDLIKSEYSPTGGF